MRRDIHTFSNSDYCFSGSEQYFSFHSSIAIPPIRRSTTSSKTVFDGSSVEYRGLKQFLRCLEITVDFEPPPGWVRLYAPTAHCAQGVSEERMSRDAGNGQPWRRLQAFLRNAGACAESAEICCQKTESVGTDTSDQTGTERLCIFVATPETEQQKSFPNKSFRPPFSKGGEVQGEEPCK